MGFASEDLKTTLSKYKFMIIDISNLELTLVHGGVITGSQYEVGEIVTSPTGSLTVTSFTTLTVTGTLTSGYFIIAELITGQTGTGKAFVSKVEGLIELGERVTGYNSGAYSRVVQTSQTQITIFQYNTMAESRDIIQLEEFEGSESGVTVTASTISSKLKITHGAITGTAFELGEVIKAEVSVDGILTITEVGDGYIIGTLTSGAFTSWSLAGVEITGQTNGGTADVSDVSPSDIPNIRLGYEDHPASHSTYGEMIIKNESQNAVTEFFGWRRVTFAIPVMINLDNKTISDDLYQLKQNIQYVFNRENKKAGRPYYYSILYDWSGLVRLGKIDLVVNAIKEFVAI